MALKLKNAHLVDPQVGLDGICDIVIGDDGRIAQVGEHLDCPVDAERDLEGKIIVPGLVDIHVHFRDPGLEYKEDIITGSRAAAHGGFVAVCTMPNTKPTTDTGAIVEYVRTKAEREGKCRVYPSGACTQGLKGETLAEMGDMVERGAVAFTDDGRGVQDSGMMRRVMEYATQFDRVVMSHCQDESLVGPGQINEGPRSTSLGLAGWPAEGEELQIQRDIALSRLTGCPLHIQHITTKRGLNLVRQAKAEGLQVTCEATPHHLFLNEDDIRATYDTNLKVNPPLRTAEDNEVLIAGVVDGTVDCIVTDHAPHADYEKDREFELAPFGMTGIETSVGTIITNLVKPGLIGWSRLVELMAINPRRILRVAEVKLAPGYVADLTVIDPDVEWTVTKDEFESRSNNCGFLGKTLVGRATDVYVGGVPTMEKGAVVE